MSAIKLVSQSVGTFVSRINEELASGSAKRLEAFTASADGHILTAAVVDDPTRPPNGSGAVIAVKLATGPIKESQKELDAIIGEHPYHRVVGIATLRETAPSEDGKKAKAKPARIFVLVAILQP